MNAPEIWYFAFPIDAPGVAGVADSLARAGRWLAWLRDLEPRRAITAPWLGALRAGIDGDTLPASRARGLRDNVAIARRCDGIVLCGGRISAGMQVELAAVIDVGGAVADLTTLTGGRISRGLPISAEPPMHDKWPPGQSPLRVGRDAWSRRLEISP